MSVKVKGIVLNETSYSESSKILQVLTNEYGLISIISKGCKSIKSKYRGISNKLNYCNYDINYKENGISTLIDGSIIDSFSNIYVDFKKCSFAFYFISIIYKVLKDNNDKLLFNLLESILIKVNEGISCELITLCFYVKLTKFLGVDFDFNSCSCCSSNLVTSLSLEGCLCDNCKSDYFISNKCFNLIKTLYFLDINSVKNMEISDTGIFLDCESFMIEFYNKYTGIYLTSVYKIGKI